MPKLIEASSAVLSGCGEYRYVLTRPTGVAEPGQGPALFIMLNPSTADASEDDPTIRRCLGFARSWGCSGLVVANLYALRATDPAVLKFWPGDPVGPENDSWLRRLLAEHKTAVCAWGAKAEAHRVAWFKKYAKQAGASLQCLGQTANGSPRHPLYLRADTPLEAYGDE